MPRVKCDDHGVLQVDIPRYTPIDIMSILLEVVSLIGASGNRPKRYKSNCKGVELMSNFIPDISLQDNTSQRLPCILVLDGSGSMAGVSIDELNSGLRILEAQLKADDIASQRVQLLVIRFGGEDEVTILSDWTDAMDWTAPTIDADGRTPIGMAMRNALSLLEEQKQKYRSYGIPYNRPWIFLITDGEPTDNGWEKVAIECRNAETSGKAVIFGIGTGDANLEQLGQFSVREPIKLDGLKFKELFIWLSQSASSASRTTQGTSTQLPSISGWGQIPT